VIVGAWQRIKPGPQAATQRAITAYGVAALGLVLILIA